MLRVSIVDMVRAVFAAQPSDKEPAFAAYKDRHAKRIEDLQARSMSRAEARELERRLRAIAAREALSPAEREFLYGSHAGRH